MSANDIQVGGDHYKASDSDQPWDFIEKHGLGFIEGNIVKYTTRWRKKNGEQDLRKVLHYVVKLEELHHETGREPRSNGAGPLAIERFLDANGVEDFRERILISIFAGRWTKDSFAHAKILVKSLLQHQPVMDHSGEAAQS